MSRSVGEFTLMGHLGEGSFATVFLARQRETGREFAMKAISRTRVQGKLQENLESEISILKSFRHGNIVELYDIKKTERHIYLVLEYCAGGDLRALIRKEGRLAEPATRHFMRHLGSGLHFLWSKHLVHRDLKPQNLLLTGPGLDATLKIADFGFARHLAQASMAETICGSPLYMAPEILQGHKYGAKADLWSVGAILFEMLAGKPPFGGQNQIQLLANIRRGPNPPARDGFYPLPEGVPRPGRSCNELLCRLLVPDPQQRASFREFFQSDVLRATLADGNNSTAAAAAAAAEAASGGSGRVGGVEGGRRDSSAIDRPAAGVGGGGNARTATERDLGVASSGSVAYSVSTQQQQQQQQQQRGSVMSQSRGGRGVQQSPAATGGGSGRNRTQQDQGNTRGAGGGGGGGGGGGWWPLQGWRWGGGGVGNDATGVGARARGPPDEDGRFKPLSRTFSEPPVVAQRTRLQTPPSRGKAGGGGGWEYPGPQVAGAGGRSSSKGQWAGTPQQAVPTRPPLTPPSPAQGSGSSYSMRGSRAGVRPIPIRQQQQQQQASLHRGGVGGWGYVDRDTQGNEGWSHGYDDAGASGYPSSQWPRYGVSPIDGRFDGGGDDGYVAAPQAYEPQQRLRSNGPNSAPEVSYMGYAASRARERGAAAAAAAAAGLRGVAFSLVGDSPPQSARKSPHGPQPSPSPQKDSLGLRGVVDSPSSTGGTGGGRHARPPSLDLGGRAPEPTHRVTPAGGQLLAMTSQSASASFQALSSSPPDRYPLQLAAMVTAGRQRMWGGAGGLGVAEGGGGPGSATGFTYQTDANVGAAGGGAGLYAGGGFDRRGMMGKLNDESWLQQQQLLQQQQQQQQQGHQQHQQQGRRTDSNDDGSGGSDDFVLVDGTSSSDPNVGPMTGAAGVGGGHIHTAYRLGGEGDPRTLGPRLVAAGGRRVWGGSGQVAFGLHQQGLGVAPRGGGGDTPGVADGRGGVGMGAAAPPLSLEGILRCLQIVELFGRRAVLLAELGDSRVAPAMRCRQRSNLDVHAKAAGGAWGAGVGSSGGAPGGSFDQTSGRNLFAFSMDKPPLFADMDEQWLPCSHNDSSCYGSRGGVGGGTSLLGSTSSSTCSDSHRLFGEALVLYLKSLSMAKEAIVWGKQALECLPAANSSSPSSSSSSPSRHVSQNQAPPPPPPSPPVSSPALATPPSHAPAGSPHVRSPSAGRAACEGGDAATQDQVSNRSQQHRQQHQEQQQQQRKGPGKLGGGAADGRSSAPPTHPEGVPSSLPLAAAAASLLSSEAQVAAWGSSLLSWLTGQFSAVLRRAERCRTELRAASPGEALTATSAATPADSGAAPEASAFGAPGCAAGRGTSAAFGYSPGADAYSGGAASTAVPSHPAAGGVGGGMRNMDPVLGVGGAAVSASPERSSALVPAGRGAGNAPAQPGDEHVAAPTAVAVSARDIVVRAALAMAKESAASEVLGMWEPARQGYERAALLLETLLLDALVSRPEAGAGLSRNAAGGGGQPGAASPKIGWVSGGGGGTAAPGDSLIATGARGGVLSEADQRVLQNYMTRFARRATDVARIEKEEARVAGAAEARSATQAKQGVNLWCH